MRVGPLAAIPQLLRELGCDPRPIVRAAGFELAFFDDPELPIPYRAGSALLARCVAATGCEHFGLMLGERAGPSSLGLAGFLMMNAPDVGRALEDLVHYLSLHDRGGIATFEVRNGTALLGFTVIEPETQAVDQICDLSMAVARNLMRGLCGPTWVPSQLLLPRKPPADPTPWTRVFNSPVQFNAGQCAVAFPTRWLAHPVAVADPLLHRHLKQQADELRHDTDFASEVRRLVSGTIAHRASTAAHVAQLLGMHEKTLNRRLLEVRTDLQERARRRAPRDGAAAARQHVAEPRGDRGCARLRGGERLRARLHALGGHDAGEMAYRNARHVAQACCAVSRHVVAPVTVTPRRPPPTRRSSRSGTTRR